MKTCVQLVQLAWEAGRAGDTEGARLIGADAARLDAAFIGQRKNARMARQELTATRTAMVLPPPGPTCRWAGKTCDCLECVQAKRGEE